MGVTNGFPFSLFSDRSECFMAGIKYLLHIELDINRKYDYKLSTLEIWVVGQARGQDSWMLANFASLGILRRRSSQGQ